MALVKLRLGGVLHDSYFEAQREQYWQLLSLADYAETRMELN